MTVVNAIKKKHLIRSTISRYGYYIIRLASRRNIPLIKQPNDLKENTRTSEIDYLALFMNS